MRTTTSAAAGLVLLAGLLAGCGSDSGGDSAGDSAGAAPADASEQDFCDAYAGLFERMGSLDPSDTDSGIKAMQDWATEMEGVGTPKGIPDDARQGFEVLLQTVQDVDPNASEEELNKLGDELSKGDQDSGEAFIEYATTTCPDAMKGLLGNMKDQLGDLQGSPSPEG